MKPIIERLPIRHRPRSNAASPGRARTLAFIGSLACAVPAIGWAAPPAQEKLAFYYGEPHKVNDSNGDTTKAAAVFAAYDLVVFPEKVDEHDNPSHGPAIEIIGKLPTSTRVYGYVDLCLKRPEGDIYRCTKADQNALEERVRDWKDMGAQGIFLDQAGCNYGVNRERLNLIVDYIHQQNLSAFVNVWNQDHAFSPAKTDDDCNKQGLATKLDHRDYSLLESWAVVLSDWTDSYPPTFVPPVTERGALAAKYKQDYGTKFATVNTVAAGNPPFDQREFDYTWWATAFYGLDAMAWGETWIYSSDTNQLPFRPRPNIDVGTGPIDVTHNGDLHTRLTSAGRLLLDTNGHTGRFAGKNLVTQSTQRPTDLVSADAEFTPTTVTLRAESERAPIKKFQFFIDSDNNPATGYLHADEGLTTVGADYMVDNEDLYSFSGATQTTWSWQIVASVTPSGVDTKHVSVPVTLSQIGHTSGVPLRLLAANSTPTWKPLDFLPRVGAEVWAASPAAFQQSGTEPNHLIAADAAVVEYQRTLRLKFTLRSQGLDADKKGIKGYRFALDMDKKVETGYPFWGVGAEYMIENGRLYKHDPDMGGVWPWALTRGSATEFGTEPGDGIGKQQISASILPELIGFQPGQEISVVAQHWLPVEPYPSLDTLPRNPGATPWKVTHTGAKQEATADTLIRGDATFAADAVSFTVNSNGGPINSYRLFIDRDNSSATGYRHTAIGITGTGAEYMVEDGKLHQFCGTTQTEWCWTFISNEVSDSGYGSSQLTVSVPKVSIAYVAGSTLALVAQNFVSNKESLDHLVRSGATVWRARP